MTLRSAGVVPPTVLKVVATETPLLPLPRAAVPAASVPM
jgi:hypothetical protein